MKLLDLFSGIGGFSLGLERAGFETVAFCEIEPFCRDVLRKHWPHVPIYEDIRTLTADRLRADGITVDAICGGFPCQDISLAGKGAGIEGARSGLWAEYARLIGDLQPRVVIVENVAALRSRGLDRVLGEMAALGYDAEWHCIPASAVGAPHRRDRLWIVAHTNPNSGRQQVGAELDGSETQDSADRNSCRQYANGLCDIVAHATRHVCGEQAESGAERERVGAGGQPVALANPNEPRLQGWLGNELRECTDQRLVGPCGASDLADTALELPYGSGDAGAGRRPEPTNSRWWLAEPDVGRVAHGVPARVHRLRALGNAVVPQIPEILGRAIIACAS